MRNDFCLCLNLVQDLLYTPLKIQFWMNNCLKIVDPTNLYQRKFKIFMNVYWICPILYEKSRKQQLKIMNFFTFSQHLNYSLYEIIYRCIFQEIVLWNFSKSLIDILPHVKYENLSYGMKFSHMNVCFSPEIGPRSARDRPEIGNSVVIIF